jgi:hypothetical protein
MLPFKVVYSLFSFFIALAVGIGKLAGRSAALLLGIGLITVGAIFSMTIVGALLGVPLAVFGAILVFKVAL